MSNLSKQQFKDSLVQAGARNDARYRNKQINHLEHSALEPRSREDWGHAQGECNICHSQWSSSHPSIVD